MSMIPCEYGGGIRIVNVSQNVNKNISAHTGTRITLDFSDVVPSGYAMIGYARFILGTTYALREALQATPLAISNVNFNSTIIVANITNSDVTLDNVSGHMIIVRNDMLE